MLKTILGFVVGAACGSVATYFIVKDRAEQKAHEDNEALKDHYRQKYGDLEEKVDETIKKVDSVLDEEPVNPLREKSSLDEAKKAYREEVERVAYHDISRDNVDTGVRLNVPEPDENIGPREGIAEAPYSITPDQFAAENRHFDKITLYWWTEDQVLLNEDNEAEDLDCIGEENLDKFGEFEEDVAYIRNERLAIDYEVIRQEGSCYPSGESIE